MSYSLLQPALRWEYAIPTGDGAPLPHRVSGGASWTGIPGVLWLTVPPEAIARHGNAIQLELDGPLDLYTGHGQVITQN